MRLLWLAQVLRDAGCKVVTLDGWETRGKDLTEVRGVVWHHDAANVNASDEAVEGLLVKGRPDLAGPLCQLGLRRDGTWVVVAAGKGNHNGYGEWGNQSIGIEARNNGIGQDWPPVQVQSWVRGSAAICAHLGLTASNVKGHKETDPKRKIDPAGIDMTAMRQRIAPLITYRPPNPQPQPEDDMPTIDEIVKALRPVIREEVGRASGWTRAVAENPETADTDPNSKRLADRAAHLNPEK